MINKYPILTRVIGIVACVVISAYIMGRPAKKKKEAYKRPSNKDVVGKECRALFAACDAEPKAVKEDEQNTLIWKDFVLRRELGALHDKQAALIAKDDNVSVGIEIIDKTEIVVRELVRVNMKLGRNRGEVNHVLDLLKWVLTYRREFILNRSTLNPNAKPFEPLKRLELVQARAAVVDPACMTGCGLRAPSVSEIEENPVLHEWTESFYDIYDQPGLPAGYVYGPPVEGPHDFVWVDPMLDVYTAHNDLSSPPYYSPYRGDWNWEGDFAYATPNDHSHPNNPPYNYE